MFTSDITDYSNEIVSIDKVRRSRVQCKQVPQLARFVTRSSPARDLHFMLLRVHAGAPRCTGAGGGGAGGTDQDRGRYGALRSHVRPAMRPSYPVGTA